MGRLIRIGDLELDQDLDHARADWRIQRIGWGMMLLFVLAGLAGTFGRGPLAAARANAAGLRLDYERFARHGAETALQFDIDPDAMKNRDEVRVWLDRDFLAGNTIESIVPAPDRVSADGNAIWFTFAVADRSRPARIRFALRPDAIGRRTGRAGVLPDSPVKFRQFIFP